MINTTPDVEAATGIHVHHVLNGVASFDTVPLDAAPMGERLQECRRAGPSFLVREDGELVGCAHATPIRPRSADASAIEDSIYVRHGRVREGTGRGLLGTINLQRALAST